MEESASYFTRHLHDTGESYGEHLLFTLRIAALLFIAGAAIIIHGLLPFILVNTGSTLIGHVNSILAGRRARQKPAG